MRFDRNSFQPRNRTSEVRYSPVFVVENPPWLLSNGTQFATVDLPFVHYFIAQFPSHRFRMFAEFSRPLAQFLVESSTRNDVLQHATVALAALLASTDPDGQPEPTQACLCRYLEHKQVLLQLLQRRIKSLDINPSLSAAIAFLLMGEMGETRGPHPKVHMHGLKSVLEHLQSTSKQHVLFSDNSGLIWVSLAVAIRLDIALAVDGDPILDPVPINSGMENTQSTWIRRVCQNSSNVSKAVEWGSAIFTLRLLEHRAFYIASLARQIRDYSPEQEATIQAQCSELEVELELWSQRPIIRTLNELKPTRLDLKSFLHYEPLEIHDFGAQLLMNEYRMTVLYNSLIAHPEIGPGFGSKRFSTAVELCRTLVSLSSHPLWRWSSIIGVMCLFQLFLCCLSFGGDDFYPLESEAALDMFTALVPEGLGSTPEQIFRSWSTKCPGLSPIITIKGKQTCLPGGPPSFCFWNST